MKKKIVFKNIIFSLIRQLIQMVYGFIVPIILIKKFGSSTNGLVSSITQFLAYVELLEGGIGPIIKNALFEPLVKKQENKINDILGATDKFFKRISYIFIIYIVVLCFLYPLINNEFSKVFTITLLLIISLSTFFEYFLGIKYKIILQADQKNYVLDMIDVICCIFNLIIIVVLVKFNFNIQAVKLFSACIFICKPLAYKYYFEKNYKYKINKKSNYKFKKQWDGLYHHIAATVQSNTDVVLLTIFSNFSAISIYSIYSLITNGIKLIVTSLTSGIDAFLGKMMVSNNLEDLREKFNQYSIVYYTLITILLTCTLLLINPFVKLYTSGIDDLNYVQPLFGYLMVLAQFNFVIRYPYSTLVYAKGHFKETRNFSIVEPIVNLVISIVLVQKYNIIGVVIGTIISMLIRSFGFISYGTKNILKQRYIKSYKIITISYLEMIFIFVINLIYVRINIDNFIIWVLYAIVMLMIVTTIVIIVNYIFYKEDFKKIVRRFKHE